MIVAIIIPFIPCVSIHGYFLFQITIHQGTKMMTVVSFPGSCLQDGDYPAFCIHAHMRLVSEKVFDLFFFLPFFVFDLAFVFYSPFGIWIMRPFAFVLPFLVFVCIYISNGVHTVY